MAGWHFIPWTLQYIVGGGLALIIALYILSKNPKSWVYRYFFLFGLSASMWEFLAFFHRNAPTADLSAKFLEVDAFLGLLCFPFLLAMLLAFRKEKPTYSLVLIPPLVAGILMILITPFDIFWTNFGWSYKFLFTRYMVFVPYLAIWIGYTLSIIIVGGLLIKRSKVTVLRKKIALILSGFIIFYVIGLTASNLLMSYTGVPPLGGILVLLTFLVIACAVSLPTEKITTPSKIHLGYPLFLNKLLEETPGRELGQNVAVLNGFLKVTGLSEAVFFEKGKITLDSDKLNSLNLLEPAEKTLEYLEKHDWATEARAYCKDVFINTYLTTREKSRKTADEWFKGMLRKHSDFFSTYGIMDAIPEDVELPKDVLDAILKSILPEKYRLKGDIIYFIMGDGVEKSYKFFTGLTKYARTLCLTGTNPREVRETYGLEGVSIVWVTFEKYAKGKIIPSNKLDELTGTISKFFGKGKGVVFVDCIDSMVMANGFKRVMGWLKGVKKIMTKSKSNLLVTIDPTSFSNRQLASIGKEMKEIKV